MTTQTPKTQTPDTSPVAAAWDAVADAFDRHATPQTLTLGERVLARVELGPGIRLLDVAAGSGGLSIPAARTGATVVAVDVSPRMIDHLVARARSEGLATLEARVGDGAALDLGNDTFDVAVSVNGVSLFPDIAAGLRELVRVTRPGGRVLIATFGPVPRAEFIAFFLGAVRAVAPGAVPAPTEPLPPFRLADATTLQRTLEEAGLRDVRVDPETWEMGFDSVDHLLDTIRGSNPIGARLTAALTDEQLGEVRQVLDGMLRERSDGGPAAVLTTDMLIGHGTV